MELLRCTQCKGDLQLSDDGLFGRCIFCGATYHFKNEKNARLISLLNQANISRLKGDFDGSILAYQIALKEDETDADAYWGIVLSTFGIDYVEDKTGKYIPTCRRTIKSSIFDDENYKKAVKFATPEQAKKFEEQATEIDVLQTKIKEKIKTEQDYDVFLCFKSTDENSNPTKDRFIARSVYDELTKRNIRTFFSEVSLKDRLGEDYEPIIYKALYSCKFFILIATNSEYIQAPWVRNEWTRFRDRVADEGLENRAFALFQNVPESEMPPIFRKQGINLEKYPAGGYEIEIADGLSLKLKNQQLSQTNYNDRILFAEDTLVDLVDKRLKATKETFNERMDRATGYFDIGNTEKAFVVLEEAVDLYPRKSRAWWTMSCFLTNYYNDDAIAIHKNEELEKKILYNYNNALRFANAKEKDEYTRKSGNFFEKIDNLSSVDDIYNNYEKEAERLFENIKQLEEFQKPEKELKQREINDVKQNLEINQKMLDNLTNQISNKNYYIKDLPKIKNWFFSFLNFVSFSVFCIVIIALIVQLVKGFQWNDVWNTIILIVLGCVPILISNIAERKLRFAKVKNVIEKDKNDLETLKAENESLSKRIKESENSKQDENDVYDMLVSQQTKIKDNILKLVERIQKLAENAYVQSYIEELNIFIKGQIDDLILKNVEKINEFEAECVILKQSTQKKLDYELNNKPKYYNPKYEKQLAKSKVYIQENRKYIAVVEKEIDKAEDEIKLLNLKKRENIFDKLALDQNQTFENEQEKNQEFEELKTNTSETVKDTSNNDVFNDDKSQPKSSQTQPINQEPNEDDDKKK